MPVPVKLIKSLKEEECYTTRRTEGTIQKVIEFLQKDTKNAYSCKEITKGMQEMKYMTLLGNPIKSSVVSYALTRIKRDKKLAHIKHKGNYYWYEDEKKLSKMRKAPI